MLDVAQRCNLARCAVQSGAGVVSMSTDCCSLTDWVRVGPPALVSQDETFTGRTDTKAIACCEAQCTEGLGSKVDRLGV